MPLKLPSTLEATALSLALAGCGAVPANPPETPEEREAKLPIAQRVSNMVKRYAHDLLRGPAVDDERGTCSKVPLEGAKRYSVICMGADNTPYSLSVQSNDGLGCQIMPTHRDDTRFPPASAYATAHNISKSFHLLLGTYDCDATSCNGTKLSAQDSQLVMESSRYLCQAVGKLTGQISSTEQK